MKAGPTSTQGTNYLDEVRRIDGIWANISCSSRRVEDIIELKNCIAGVATSMRGGNYEKAAYCVQRFRLINGGVATGGMVGEVGEHERAFMTRMQRELRRTVIEKFDAAVASMVVLLAPRNSPLTLYGLLNGATICPNTHPPPYAQVAAGHVPQNGAPRGGTNARTLAGITPPENTTAMLQDVIRYCKLFGVMHLEREGLDRYTHYLRQRIAAHMQHELNLSALFGNQKGTLEYAVVIVS